MRTAPLAAVPAALKVDGHDDSVATTTSAGTHGGGGSPSSDDMSPPPSTLPAHAAPPSTATASSSAASVRTVPMKPTAASVSTPVAEAAVDDDEKPAAAVTVTFAPLPAAATTNDNNNNGGGIFARLGVTALVAALFPGPKWDPDLYLGKPINPFFYDESQHGTPLQVLKMVVVGLVLFLPRVLIIIFALILMTSSAALRVLVSGGVKCDPISGATYPLAGNAIFCVGRFGARVFLFAFGYVWISIDDQRTEEERRDSNGDAPIIAANHCSFIDPFLLAWLEGPMVASKAELTELPIVGTLCKGLQVIPISREDVSNRRNVSDEIKRRTRWQYDQSKEVIKRHGVFPPLLIFPEATCTNTKSVIQFKLGAFVPRVPVQPIALDYRQRYLDVSWVGAPSVALTALRMMCQVYNRVTVTYLPRDGPRSSEADSPVDVAQRVRLAIAAALGVPTSEHNFLDVLLERDVDALRLPAGAVNVEMGILSPQYGADRRPASPTPVPRPDERAMLEGTRRNLQAFAAFNRSGDGTLSEEDFAELLGFRRGSAERLANSALISTAFRHWDHDGDGRINFREFLLLTSAVRVSRLAQAHNDEQQERRLSRNATPHSRPSPTESADGHHHQRRSLHHVGGVVSNSMTVSASMGGDDPVAAEDEAVISDDLRRAFALSFGAFDADGDGVATIDDITSVILSAAPDVATADIRALFVHAVALEQRRRFGFDDAAEFAFAPDDDDDETATVTYDQYMLLCERHPLLVASLLDQVAVAEAASAASPLGAPPAHDAAAVPPSTAPYS